MGSPKMESLIEELETEFKQLMVEEQSQAQMLKHTIEKKEMVKAEVLALRKINNGK